MKKILISDYDFTFDPHLKDVSLNRETLRKNKEAVKRWREAGNAFVFATGRSKESFTENLPDWNKYADYSIVCDGATAVTGRGEEVFGDCFGEELAERMIQAANNTCLRQNHVYISYTGEGEKEAITPSAYKVVVWSELADDHDTIVRSFKEELDDDLDIISYCGITVIEGRHCLPQDNRETYHHMININVRGISKTHGIKRLTERIAAQDVHVITVGDGPNDLPMLTEYDGYLVERAGDDVKAKIDKSRIVPNVSDLIDKLMNQQ